METIVKKINANNYFVIDENGISQIVGGKAHELYFAFLKEARKYYKTLEEQEKIVLYCIVRNL